MRRRTSSDCVEDIQARHAHRAGGGRQEAGQDAHGGALARAVGAEQADDLAAPDREGDIRYRGVARVALGQVGDFNHQIIAH